MMNSKNYDIFLSYSSHDRDWVTRFADSIEKSGIKLWFDMADLRPGDNWEEQVQKALRESTTLVIVLSQNNMNSAWTYFELGAAVADNKLIIPVLTPDSSEEAIPKPLSHLQYLQAKSPQEAGKRVAEIISSTAKKSAKAAH